MADLLPALRATLDIFPSTDAKHPGLVLRDPFGYTRSVLVIPPVWFGALSALDGAHTMEQAEQVSRRLTGIELGHERLQQLLQLLREHGFLQTPEFEALRRQRIAEFRGLPQRPMSHAGAAYPAIGEAAQQLLTSFFSGGSTPGNRITSFSPQPKQRRLLAIAAPHVSPHGGIRSYVSAYQQLPELNGRTVIILGTSHYGDANCFGVTAKPYTTPLGQLEVDQEALSFLRARAGSALVEEDYCHAIEHSIEFQALFTSYRQRQPPRILPILCGPLAHDPSQPGMEPPPVRQFLDALETLAHQRGEELFWILGVDFAHIGKRYGDEQAAQNDSARMSEVERHDMERLRALQAADLRGFRSLVHPAHPKLDTALAPDVLRWCGYSPLYTFLRTTSPHSGDLLCYEQWNIDPGSVVSFGALRFYA